MIRYLAIHHRINDSILFSPHRCTIGVEVTMNSSFVSRHSAVWRYYMQYALLTYTYARQEQLAKLERVNPHSILMRNLGCNHCILHFRHCRVHLSIYCDRSGSLMDEGSNSWRATREVSNKQHNPYRYSTWHLSLSKRTVQFPKYWRYPISFSLHPRGW